MMTALAAATAASLAANYLQMHNTPLRNNQHFHGEAPKAANDNRDLAQAMAKAA